ncbi:MAG: penicillin-binding protein, partial [Chloroflexi bacterium]|nr:penicillin-binding protein [Chloroflexota bacterium]
MATSTRRIVKRRRERRKQHQTGGTLVLRWIAIAFLAFLGINLLGALTGVGTVVSVYAFYAQQLPEPGAIAAVEDDFETTKIYDRSGDHLLYEIIDPLGGDRTWVDLTDIPPHLQDATIAIEDRSFYENPGYDAAGIARALWNNFRGLPIQGGSSITQQLVKNVLIEPEDRTQQLVDRKIRELILAVRISNEYSKDQILEWYLNTNFYGNLAYGVEAAAQVYFDKSVSELTVGEAAMLAAIPQSPSLNPIDNYEAAKQRQRVVLDSMVEAGYLTSSEASAAYEAPLVVHQPQQRFDLRAPHFSIAVRQELERMFGAELVYRGGLVVYTTLDYDLQLQVECAAQTHVARLSGQAPTTVVPAADGSDCIAARYLHPLDAVDWNVDHQVSNAAIVVMSPSTGEVLSLLGSLDYFDDNIDGNFNVAFAERQPGSAIKPFTYLTAFEQGYTPATMTLDVRTAFDIGSNQPYVPENFDREFHGPQSIRSALANSYNVPAVEVLEWVGIDNVIRTAHALGINSLDRGVNNYGLALTLGGGEVTLYDMTYSYSVMANMGTMVGRPIAPDDRRPGFRTLNPATLLRVEDRSGQILWEYGKGNTFSSSPVTDPGLSYLITDILSDDLARRSSVGENSALLINRPAAVKTGTTNDFRDNWAIGYTPQIVTGVWVG